MKISFIVLVLAFLLGSLTLQCYASDFFSLSLNEQKAQVEKMNDTKKLKLAKKICYKCNAAEQYVYNIDEFYKDYFYIHSKFNDAETANNIFRKLIFHKGAPKDNEHFRIRNYDLFLQKIAEGASANEVLFLGDVKNIDEAQRALSLGWTPSKDTISSLDYKDFLKLYNKLHNNPATQECSQRLALALVQYFSLSDIHQFVDNAVDIVLDNKEIPDTFKPRYIEIVALFEDRIRHGNISMNKELDEAIKNLPVNPYPVNTNSWYALQIQQEILNSNYEMNYKEHKAYMETGGQVYTLTKTYTSGNCLFIGRTNKYYYEFFKKYFYNNKVDKDYLFSVLSKIVLKEEPSNEFFKAFEDGSIVQYMNSNIKYVRSYNMYEYPKDFPDYVHN